MADRASPEQIASAMEWNQQHEVGEIVGVALDDGTTLVTRTRSVAWLLGDGSPVVLVNEITGAVPLERVTGPVVATVAGESDGVHHLELGGEGG
jgi:hypothetical protein